MLGDTMKDLFKIFFLLSLLVVVYIFRDNISGFINDEIGALVDVEDDVMLEREISKY